MAGSLRAVTGKPNTWELRIYLGRDSEGRVLHRHATVHGTRRFAERELARLVAEQDAGPVVTPEAPKEWGPSTTVNDAIAAWRENGWEESCAQDQGDATRAAGKCISGTRSAGDASIRWDRTTWSDTSESSRRRVSPKAVSG